MIEIVGTAVTVVLAMVAGYMRLSGRVTALETKVSERNRENKEGHERIEAGVTKISGQFEALTTETHNMHVSLLEAIKANGK